MTRKIMEKLRYDKVLIKKVVRLVELHLRPHTFKMGWTDSAVRRYIVDAADEIQELNELVRSDVTTKNSKKREEIYGHLDNLQKRILEVKSIRDSGGYTCPTTIREEKKTNPFLRCDVLNDNMQLIKKIGLNNPSEKEIFKYIREWKDSK